MTFEKLESRMARRPSGHTYREWLCRCACGDTRWKSNPRGCRVCSSKTHGQSDTREYKAWYAMIHRCTVPTSQWYSRYGGRGITVSDAWRSYEVFLADMGPCSAGLTLERKDNDKGYEKGNCVWATKAEQNANRRNSRIFTAFGKTQHLAAWCREYQIPQDTISCRLKSGWLFERAVTTPVRPYGS